jgi:hypothetical protein
MLTETTIIRELSCANFGTNLSEQQTSETQQGHCRFSELAGWLATFFYRSKRNVTWSSGLLGRTVQTARDTNNVDVSTAKTDLVPKWWEEELRTEKTDETCGLTDTRGPGTQEDTECNLLACNAVTNASGTYRLRCQGRMSVSSLRKAARRTGPDGRAV